MDPKPRLRAVGAAAVAGIVAALVGYVIVANETSAQGKDPSNEAGMKILQRAHGSADSKDPAERLPDLDQETPRQLRIKVSRSPLGKMYRLGFRSAVRNVGDGPLKLVGSRPDRHTPYLTVTQIIKMAGRLPIVVPGVGRMKYTISPDHRHWHYLDFEHYELQRYELLALGASKALRTDRKTGFCLGDRYRIHRRLQAAPPEPVYTGRCALNQPMRLYIRAGISVGYGDDYAAFLEGQDLKLNGLAAGRYMLVHRVNADRGLRESQYGNNAASVLLRLRWRDGTPSVRVLKKCPRTDRCLRS